MELLFGIVLGLVIGAVGTQLLRPRPAASPATPTPASSATPTTASSSRDQAGSSDALQSSLQAIDLGILVFDSHGTEIYRNPAGQFASLTRPTQAIIDGEVRELIASMVDAEVAAPAEREVVLYGPPRTVLLIRALPSLVDDARGFVVVIDDVTRERQLDEVRRSFVTNVSHELRTPVGAIAVLAETMSASDDPATIERLGERLTTAAHRLADMIEDLLELSRTEGDEIAEAEAVAISDVISDVTANLTASAQAVGVDLVVSVEPVDLVVRGDRRQLRSAVQNLVDNAIKYSDAGGEIRIVARPGGKGVSISVADEGIGIPEADLDRVFERFYRVDAARRRETGGTGLGLSIVRHVALNHGGDVSAFSVEGEGTTFTIELPVLEPTHA